MAGYIGKSQGVTQVDGYNRTEADDRYVNASGDTMTGDLIVGGSVTATTLRPKNSFAFRAYQSSAQTVSNSTFTKVQFGAEDFDVGGCFDSATNYRFTPTVAGYYLFTCHINFQASTSMSRNILRITRNGTESGSYGRTVDDSNTGSGFNIMSGSDLIYLNGTTDYVEVYGWLQGTGTLTFGSNDANTSVFTGLLVEEA